MSTLLCVPIMVLDEPSALADAHAARDLGADMVEFRVDEFFTGAGMSERGEGPEQGDPDEVRLILRLVSECPLPCIVTCRAASEGGSFNGDEVDRVSLYERLGTAATGGVGGGEHPPRYIDVEYAAYVRSANIRQKINLAVDHPGQRRDVRTGLILSMHDFEGRPKDLLRRLSLMQSEPAASVVKVAYHARSIRDNLELFDLLTEGAGGRPMIALAMGRFGLMSRVLAPKFGAFLTFAALRPAGATAPGQPTIREVMDLYRFRSVSSRTRVYGIIGWPVEHSLSPLVHNAGFEAYFPNEWGVAAGGRGGDAGAIEGVESAARGVPLRVVDGFDGVYLPMPVPPEWEHFKATLSALLDHPRLDFHGCSVTVPHKQHLVRYAKETAALGADGIEWTIDEAAEACGAANTLVVERNNAGLPTRARLMNTDGTAAADCLREVMGDLRGKRVAILGAGGAARAIAAALVHEGTGVTVYNRTLANAERVVADLRQKSKGQGFGAMSAAGLGDLGSRACDAIVNCTPVGMSGGERSDGAELSPITPDQLRAVARGGSLPIVMDTVYTPLRTPLLQMAEGVGCRTIDGLGMFIGQACEQFAAWTGRPAPRGLFERVAREELEQRASSHG